MKNIIPLIVMGQIENIIPKKKELFFLIKKFDVDNNNQL